MPRVFNFSAGPAALPLEVLEIIRADIPDWGGTGMSVMEVSHRGKALAELKAEIPQVLKWLDQRLEEEKPPKPDHDQYMDNDWSK